MKPLVVSNIDLRPLQSISPPLTSPQWGTSYQGPSRLQGPVNNQGLHNQHPGPRPYLGYCQVCGHQGNTAKRCPSFKFVPQETDFPKTNNNPNSWQQQAHLATSNSPNTLSWLLDNGASDHITSNLNNLSLHTPYTSSDDVMIGDGSSLRITHTGSTTLQTFSNFFNLKNILCVPEIKKNLISIY